LFYAERRELLLRTFGGEHKEAVVQAFYDTEKEEGRRDVTS